HYYKDENIFSSIEKLQNLILRKFNLLIKFGIGNNSVNYQELKASYKNAKEILKISTIFSTKKSIFDYNKMDLELLFLNLKKNAIENFKNKVLENISEKDFEEFSNILSVYEEENGSVIHAAEKLFMHKNTLQYKLNKIKRLSGYDPRNLKDFTILSLAFKLKNLE
ncbi:helix-turn-helix domain-containing protein, partial [Fusobacterium simiae]